jgi:hypothetical protein
MGVTINFIGGDPREIEAILNCEIVIERSPAFVISFKELLKAKSTVMMGAFVGVASAQYPILLLSVPAGIILVGAAKGVSRALETGLPSVLKKYMRYVPESSGF